MTDFESAIFEKKCKLEYQAGLAIYQRNGISEADFIVSRRIDEGHEQLIPTHNKRKGLAAK